MTMKAMPYSLVLIKPLTVGRGQAPLILEDILSHGTTSLRCFREWEACATTWRVLYPDPIVADAHIEICPTGIGRKIWVGLFTHLIPTKSSDLTLDEIIGPKDPILHKPHHIRYKYKPVNRIPHPADDVIHVSAPERTMFEAMLLFRNFNEEEFNREYPQHGV